MPRLYIIVSFVFLSSFVFGQQELKRYIEFAQKKYQEGDYVYALEYYKKAMQLDSNTIDILWEYAQTLRAYKDYRKAAYYYGKVYQREAAELYPSSLLYYGLMTKQLGDYQKALALFKTAKKKYRRRNRRGYLYKKSRQEVKSCIWAAANQGDSLHQIFEHLPDLINSNDAEFVHRIQHQKLYFSSLRADSIGQREEVYDPTYKTHLFTSEIKDSSFIKPQKLKQVNFKGISTGNGTFSLDGKRFYFSYCDDNGVNYRCKIMIAHVVDGKFKRIDSLGAIINTYNANTTMPFIGEWMGKEVLFFSSDREGGEGGMDLWYSFIENGNQYSRPRNMRRINTPDNELSPFWNSKNKILYFSSSWYNGFGGYDIFKSQYNTHFEPPVNLMEPVNSPANDLYYFQTQTKDSAYFSSNRLGSYYSKNPTCCSDIYLLRKISQPKLPTIKESLKELNKRLPVTLYFHNDIPNPKSWDTITQKNYIATYQDYIAMENQYKSEYSSGLNGEEAIDAKEDIENFFLQYVKQGIKDLQKFRDLLLAELQRGRNLVLTVKGFASPLAKTDYNVNLTKRRIASLRNYLYRYDNGVFQPYLDDEAVNGGALAIQIVPFGEYEANQLTSDNPNDMKNSVYSRAAALDRKIEIQSIDVMRKKDSVITLLSANELVYDAGVLDGGTPIQHSFEIQNVGQNIVHIDTVIVSMNRVHYELVKRDLLPGETTEIKIDFDTNGEKGYKVVGVEIKYNNIPKGLHLSITTQLK